MLSYQHHYHAGNHADVLKHWLLLECVNHLQNKDKPFEYIDTHAGAGLYSFKDSKAQKTQEYLTGISKLVDAPVIAEMQDYLEAVTPYLTRKKYPGSPLIVSDKLRSTDRSWLYELHPQTLLELEKNQRGRKIRVHEQDGFKGLLGLLPVHSRRALVLVDPSYEIKSDYQTVVDVMEKSLRKMAQTLFMIWYPVVDRSRIDFMEKRLKKSGLKNIWLYEMGIEAEENKGMTASGMIICNPPWTLQERANKVLPWLSSTLSIDGETRYRVECLCAE